MLKKNQRIALRSLGQKLPDLVYLGKNGITENIITQINDNLNAYELIKVKVQANSPEDIMQLAESIEDACFCETVTIIGNKILFYKQSENKKINKHIALVRETLSKCN